MTKLHDATATRCPDEADLAAFLGGKLKDGEARAIEEHIAGCPACLESVRAGYLGERSHNAGDLPASNMEIIRKAKGLAKMDSRKKHFKANLWLAATVAAFLLSFTVPKYFAQFLAAALILGLKWVSESESVRTLIVAMDSKRRHENKEEEISKWGR
ncbi:MAG: zf-HC2 domain-containing protein [Candidatus Omnitrophica bacterium]|nr:zf-HC2 domain-containing protein [Candidatus Omnitrophota bacterium]MDD5546589.1 zf-HC2 domain-containing protein [Candidatus Omnitrophota bacterium]